MDIKNKKINCLGDSITEGHGASEPSKNWVSLLQSKYGAITRNYGIGGTRIAPQITPSVCDRWDLDFISRVDEMDEDADIITVFGGTNDFGHGDAPFGRFEDRTADTFCGSCHVLLSKLIEKYPTSIIVVMTPLSRSTRFSRRSDGCGGTVELTDYVDIIKRTAEYYSLPCLDLYRTSGMPLDMPSVCGRYSADGLHPNDFGYMRIADRLASFIATL